MNAVNLIPAEGRRRASLPTSRPTLALLGGLVVALVAAYLYVSAANQVTARRAQLAQTTTAANDWNAAAARFNVSVQAVQERQQELADVRELASSRYPWSELLSEISGLMPANAALSSLNASTSSGDASSSGGATTTPTTSGVPVPAVQLDGCAATQTAVANTMDQLRKITGVTAVTLSSSQSTAASSGTQTTGAAAGACPFTVQFQMSLTFGSTSATPAATSTSTSTGSAAATTTPTTTTAAPQ